MHYPLSVLEGSANDALGQIISFHVPQGASVLDPTAGDRIMWGRHLAGFYNVTFHDKKEGQDLFSLLSDHPEYEQAFECIVYDPPYMVGVKESRDPRQNTYGGYGHGEWSLRSFMAAIHDPLSHLLKDDGLLILKCADQFVPDQRVLRLWHYDWMSALLSSGFEIADFYIYRYHRVSPTAFQVKNRPAAVVVHTYFIVARLKNRRPLDVGISFDFLA